MRKFLAFFAMLAVSATPPARAETVRVGGTGTATALFHALAGPFAAAVPGDTLEVIPGLGSGGGIAAVEGGALNLAYSGRGLSPKEAAGGLAERPLLDTPLLFVAHHPGPLALSSAEIVRIFSGEMPAYADASPLKLILRPRADALTLALTAAIPNLGPAMDKARQRQDLPVAATDQDNLDLAGSIPGAFTAAGLAQLRSEPNALTPVRLDGAGADLDALARSGAGLRLSVTLVTRAAPDAATQRFLAFLAGPAARAVMDRAGARPLP